MHRRLLLQRLDPPSVVNGAHLLDAMSQGKLAGRLDIHVVDGSFTFKDRGARALHRFGQRG